jgi:DNA-directed RNA polymerase specialized sigma24 family protein
MGVPVSLTEALRARAPQAFAALYDEYAGALYAYCFVMIGDEAGEALRDTFVAVARHPDAIPRDDAELPVWLHTLARAECVRRGALVRGVVTTTSVAPPRRALARLSPEHREVLALFNALTPDETAQILGVTRNAAETLVREARWRLERAAASVGGADSAMLGSLSGEALHRLVTLGYEPPAGQREWVLSSCATAGRAPGAAAVFDATGTPLPPDAFSAQAGDTTDQFPRISPDEPATAPLRRVDGISADVRPDQPGPGEPAFAESATPEPGPAESASPGAGIAEAATVELGSIGWESDGAGSAEVPSANTGEPPPFVRGMHAKPRKPFRGRRFVPVAVLVACAAAVAGVALAWPDSHHAKQTSGLVRQSVRPSRSARPTPSADPASPSPQEATSDPEASPTDTAAAPPVTPPPSSTAPADGSDSAAPSPRTTPPAPRTTPPAPPTTRPKPRHTATPGAGHRGPGRACRGIPRRPSRCVRPHPWHPWRPHR